MSKPCGLAGEKLAKWMRALTLCILGIAAFSLSCQTFSQEPRVGKASGWAPVPGHIMTSWAAKVDPAKPLPEHPNPQMVRKDWVNLNGLWEYTTQTLDASAPDKYAGQILVPFPIESALSGVKKPLSKSERLWYKRTFAAPALAGGKRLLLHFQAVDWEAKVFVNGKSVGEHRGGYDAFTFDITAAVKAGGENELVVSVFDETGGYQPKGKQNFNSIAKPSGIMYTPCSGIWQTVWLEPVPAAHIREIAMTPDIDAHQLRLTVATADAVDFTATARLHGKAVGRVTAKSN
ncbi:MAG: glycoside hydrolase family 2, partial [Candidatus Sumerlaeota bacterium]|nr:glycoside hydrolase family 2 [Candidatus Sumerlaeota bacterium]